MTSRVLRILWAAIITTGCFGMARIIATYTPGTSYLEVVVFTALFTAILKNLERPHD